jgi:hypothetical protein
VALAAACLICGCNQQAVATPPPSPSPRPSVSPLPPAVLPPPCVQTAARPLASGVTSAYPVERLASGLNGPDDLLYVDADGSMLVGEHGDGHLAKLTTDGVLVRLPQVVPLAEGIAQMAGITYVADQANNSVVALTDTGLRTVLSLQPDPSGQNLDGIAASGGLIVVPDSPHGTVLFIDASGHVIRTDRGYSRPAGVWANPTGQGGPWLIADEGASAIFALQNAGGHYILARNLPGVDDVVRDNSGHVIVILPGLGRLYDVTTGHDIARGLRNPQGLGFDGAQNILLTESDNGRLDRVVRTFALQPPPPGVRLQPGQGVCIGIRRAPGYNDPVRIDQVTGAGYDANPTTSGPLEVYPFPCTTSTCTVSLTVRGSAGVEFASFSYRD